MHNADDYVVIGHAGSYEHYDWNEIYALYYPKGDTFHLYADSGCSCNYAFDEYWSPGQAMSKSELIEEIYSYRSDSEDSYDLEDVNDMAQAVREFDERVDSRVLERLQ